MDAGVEPPWTDSRRAPKGINGCSAWKVYRVLVFLKGDRDKRLRACAFDSTAILLSVPGAPPGLPSLAVANHHLKLRFKSRGVWPYAHMGKAPDR